MPKNGLKYKKYHKSRVTRVSATRILYCPDTNSIDIITVESMRIAAWHISAIRRTVRRLVKKMGRLNRHNALYLPITQKPAQIRMGKGKGAVSYWATKIVAGTSIYYFRRLEKKIAFEAMLSASTKLPGRSYVLKTLSKKYIFLC